MFDGTHQASLQEEGSSMFDGPACGRASANVHRACSSDLRRRVIARLFSLRHTTFFSRDRY